MPRAVTKKKVSKKAARTRRAKKAMRGGDNSFVVQVDLSRGGEPANIRPDVVAANAQAIAQWYGRIAMPEDEFIIDPVMTHINGDRFRVDFQPGVNRDPEGLEAEFITFANPDKDGNNPLTINGVEYIVSGEVVEGAQGGRRRRRRN
jgi:hypothetical protein